MKDAQLEKMSVAELIDLKKRIDVVISGKQDRERTELKERLESMAKEHGFSIGDLFAGRGRGKAKSSAAVKYRNPDDHSQTWTGRGRKPNWLSAAGGDIERFRVK